MSLLHVPVRIIAADPAESLAFTDVLNSGQAGALALAGADEKPLVALVCPSGRREEAGEIPCVVLGESVPLPARLSDVLEALEGLASAMSGLSGPRSHKGWTLDPARLALRTPGEGTITLTDTEARLLACLFDAGGADVPRDALLQRVWGYRPGLDTHTLETHIYRLRKKLEADPAKPALIITTEQGYHFAFA